MRYPLVRDLAADGIPVAVACRVLGFSTQGFNKWRRNPVSQRDWDNAHLTNLAHDIHHDDPTFGYRFVSDEIADRVAVHGVSASQAAGLEDLLSAASVVTAREETRTDQESRASRAR